MSADRLLAAFHRISEAPDAVDRFRGLVVALGVRGDLTSQGPPQAPEDVRARQEAIQAGMSALVVTRPRYRWTPAAEPNFGTPQALPGWLPSLLADTGLYVNGLAFKPTDWGRTGRPIIRIQNLSGVSPEYNCTEREVGQDNLVADGDLLVSWSATLDTFIWQGPEGVLNQHIFKVIPNAAAVTHGFLYWLLKHEVRVLAESQHAHGLAMMHINRGPFLTHPVLLPPLEEQDRIVAKVDELMALCDQLENAHAERERRRDRLAAASLARLCESDPSGHATRFALKLPSKLFTRPESLNGLRQTIYDLATAGRLSCPDPSDESVTELTARLQDEGKADPRRRRSSSAPFALASAHLPAHWVVESIAALSSSIDYGTSVQATRNSTGIPVLRMGNLARGCLFFGDLKYLRREELDERLLLRPGDLLFNRTNSAELVGKSAVFEGWQSPIAFASYLIRVRPLPSADMRWAHIVLSSTAGKAYLAASRSQQTGQANINGSKLAAMPIPLPPLAEQRRIVARVDELMAVCDDLERSLTAVHTGRARLLEAVLQDALAEVDAELERDLVGVP